MLLKAINIIINYHENIDAIVTIMINTPTTCPYLSLNFKIHIVAKHSVPVQTAEMCK